MAITLILQSLIIDVVNITSEFKISDTKKTIMYMKEDRIITSIGIKKYPDTFITYQALSRLDLLPLIPEIKES